MEAKIELIKEEVIANDEIGNEITAEKGRLSVYAEVHSVASNEFFKAAEHGMDARYKFKVHYVDYHNETKISYLGNIYTVYRTFFDEKIDKIELYVRD